MEMQGETGRGDGGREGERGGVWLMDENWVAFSSVYSMEEAAAASVHLSFQSSIHSSMICRRVKRDGFAVCNPPFFLFLSYREGDMVSVSLYIFCVAFSGYVVARLLQRVFVNVVMSAQLPIFFPPHCGVQHSGTVSHCWHHSHHCHNSSTFRRAFCLWT